MVELIDKIASLQQSEQPTAPWHHDNFARKNGPSRENNPLKQMHIARSGMERMLWKLTKIEEPEYRLNCYSVILFDSGRSFYHRRR